MVALGQCSLVGLKLGRIAVTDQARREWKGTGSVIVRPRQDMQDDGLPKGTARLVPMRVALVSRDDAGIGNELGALDRRFLVRRLEVVKRVERRLVCVRRAGDPVRVKRDDRLMKACYAARAVAAPGGGTTRVLAFRIEAQNRTWVLAERRNDRRNAFSRPGAGDRDHVPVVHPPGRTGSVIRRSPKP